MSAVIDNNFTDYKVADMSLADWGRKEIAIAEIEMPGLMITIRHKRRSCTLSIQRGAAQPTL